MNSITVLSCERCGGDIYSTRSKELGLCRPCSSVLFKRHGRVWRHVWKVVLW